MRIGGAPKDHQFAPLGTGHLVPLSIFFESSLVHFIVSAHVRICDKHGSLHILFYIEIAKQIDELLSIF